MFFQNLFFVHDGTALAAVLSLLAIIVAIVDLRSSIIPDVVLLFGFVICVLLSLADVLFHPQHDWSRSLLLQGAQMFIVLFGMWLFWYFNAEGFGYGDLKLMVLLGAFLPLPVWILLLLCACVLALLTYGAARISLLAGGFRDSRPPLPIVFGPCVAAAWFILGLAVFVFAPQLVRNVFIF